PARPSPSTPPTPRSTRSSTASPAPSSSSEPSHEHSSLRALHRARDRARQAAPPCRPARAVRGRGPSREPHLRRRDHAAPAPVRGRRRADRGRLLRRGRLCDEPRLRLDHGRSPDRPRRRGGGAGAHPLRAGDRLPRPDRGRRGADRRRRRADGRGEVPCTGQVRAHAVEGLPGGARRDAGAARMSALSARTPATSETSVTVGDVVGVLEAAYPLAWAEDWDRAGLVLGEREAPVSRLLLSVDPTLAVAREAVASGAELLITHHPLLLRGASF